MNKHSLIHRCINSWCFKELWTTTFPINNHAMYLFTSSKEDQHQSNGDGPNIHLLYGDHVYKRGRSQYPFAIWGPRIQTGTVPISICYMRTTYKNGTVPLAMRYMGTTYTNGDGPNIHALYEDHIYKRGRSQYPCAIWGPRIQFQV